MFPFVVIGSLFILIVGVKTLLPRRAAGEREGTSLFAPGVEDIRRSMEDVLHEHEVSWRTIRRSPVVEWQVDVPSDLPILSLHLALQDRLREMGASIHSASSDPVRGRVLLNIGWPDSTLFRLALSHREDLRRDKGKIAIIIDDFGDRWEPFVESFMELGAEITVSVLPGRKMSRRISEEAVRRNIEVILHLPMEPLDADYEEDGYTILSGMSAYEVGRIISRGLQDVPDAAGVNNHMGSRVTSDQRLMTDCLKEVRERDLYFIDSRTTAETVAYDLARRLGIPCAERDVFLDVPRERQAIRRGLRQLAQEAEARGYSVGIGHCHRMMLEVLREEVPGYQAEGYRFVRVSDVVR